MAGINSLKGYLSKYGDMQEDIVLCYRPSLEKGWNDRCLYEDEDYDEYKAYNHRSILDNEIVIEFDDDNVSLNKELAEKVTDRLRSDKIAYSLWASGNKSFHCHFIIDMKQCLNKPLLKRVIMRHYTRGFSILPDMVLAGNHLVRAEFGIHEKTGVTKHKLKESTGYPKASELKEEIWTKYAEEQTSSVKRRLSSSLTDLSTHPTIRYLLNTAKFNEQVKDGHERTLFMLIHVLKPKYKTKEDLAKFLIEWYRYSSGTQMKDYEIRSKVNYHFNRNYTITENVIFNLAKDLGITQEDIKKNEEELLKDEKGEFRKDGK